MVKWGYTLVRTRQSVPLNPALFITVNYARVLKKIGRGMISGRNIPNPDLIS